MSLIKSVLIMLSLLGWAIDTKAELKRPLSVNQIHQKIQNKQLTSEQLVNFYLQRITRFDDNAKKLNAVVQLNKNAISQARALDKHFLKYGFKGPLHGIPILLKDNIDTLDGMANTAGSYALANNFPTNDAFLVKQLKASGAIILGKTNLSEWANFRSFRSISGWSALYGQSKNPYKDSVTPCGSSSGSAVAVAANFATITVGTETDGSITCPAAMNSVVGIKPTLGTVSRGGIIPIAHSQDTAGPLARNVTDAVILLSAMVKADKNDKGSIESNINYISHLKKGGLKGKRIGIARNLMGYHQALDDVFNQAVQDLKKQGAIIIDNTNLVHAKAWGQHEFEVLLYEFKDGLNKYLATTNNKVPKTLKEVIQYNKKHADLEMPYFEQELFDLAQAKGDLTEKTYLNALKNAKELTQNQGIDALIQKYNLDLIIAPTTSPAWEIDLQNGDKPLGTASSAAAISGYPHITLPMGYVNGLPVGISMFGGKLQEGNLIEAAYGYEQATLHRIEPF
ncbi:amidase [Colwelliaceae bacterium MEBiC 14330]